MADHCITAQTLSPWVALTQTLTRMVIGSLGLTSDFELLVKLASQATALRNGQNAMPEDSTVIVGAF
jgi:hypothetical protein